MPHQLQVPKGFSNHPAQADLQSYPGGYYAETFYLVRSDLRWQRSMRASFLIGLPARAQVNAVRYGGKPPWGLEKPVHISGKVHRGEVFEQAIGRGLDFRLEPTENRWEIMVSDAGGADLMKYSVWEPCHSGPYLDTEKYINIDKLHVGDKRELKFDLTAARTAERTKEHWNICDLVFPLKWDDPMTPAQYQAWLRKSRTRPGLDTDGGGAGMLVITGLIPGPHPLEVSLDFEVDLAFTGALELWKLRSRYIIPKGYRGFVDVYEDPRELPSPKSGDFYLLHIPASGILRTSSKLRDISGDEQYIFSDGLPLSAYGLRRPILIYSGGRHQSFFVGTDRQFDLAAEH